MTLLQALILGIVQGLTEFLPVSSSAHLVLVPHLLGWNLSEEFVFSFDVLIQLGTLVAVVYYFRKDIKEIFAAVIRGIRTRKPFTEAPARVGWLAILGTIPAGVFGLLLKDKVEAAFNSATATSVFLILTAALLVAGEYLGKRTKDLEKLTCVDALWIGAFQALAVFPGISRSGSTITGGMTRGLERKPAGQFSFLLSIPIFLAAGILGFKDLLEIDNLPIFIPSLIIGFITAGIVGYFAIQWLLGYISSHSLLPFAGYCIMLGAGSLAFTLLNPGLPEAVPPSVVQSKALSVSAEDIAKVDLSPDLEWLLPAMVDCQKKQDELTILFNQAAFNADEPLNADLVLTYGETPGLGKQVFLLGNEKIVAAVHPENPLQTLTKALSEDLFTGQTQTWEKAAEECPDCFTAGGMAGGVNLYILNPGSVFHEASRARFANGKPLSSSARLAPNSKAIRQALMQDPLALAVLPESWADASIKTLVMDSPENELPEIPILAYAGSAFDEFLATWMACVQNSIK